MSSIGATELALLVTAEFDMLETAAGDELSIAELTTGADEVTAEAGALDSAMLLGVEEGLVPPPPPPPPHAIRLSVMTDNNRAF
jgi:hypothetical protein